VTSQPASVAPVQVFGTCGQTLNVIVQGVTVSFTCLEAVVHARAVVQPGPAPGPGGVALALTALRLDPELLSANVIASSRDLDPASEPLVVPVERGSDISLSDLRSTLEQARDAGQVVRLHIE
jgi:hypothetical protein